MANRDDLAKGGVIIRKTLAAVASERGYMASITPATGHYAKATDTATERVAGVFTEAVDGTGGAGTEKAGVRSGTIFYFENDATNPVTALLLEQDCYVHGTDGKTVCATAGSVNSIVAGRAVELVTEGGVNLVGVYIPVGGN